jgi:hypothetical protein
VPHQQEKTNQCHDVVDRLFLLPRRSAAAPSGSGKDKGNYSIFARSARHILVKEGIRSPLTLLIIIASSSRIHPPQEFISSAPLTARIAPRR